MGYNSNIDDFIKILEKSKKEVCEKIGTYVVAEAQGRTPVLSGDLKRAETYEVIGDGEGVNVGVVGVPYALAVEKGDKHHKPQPYLEPSVIENINELERIAGQTISANMK